MLWDTKPESLSELKNNATLDCLVSKNLKLYLESRNITIEDIMLSTNLMFDSFKTFFTSDLSGKFIT
jgi:hypothetical protein